jgi:outer membrane protein OmpA-like peptidoglycan-associated protein
MRFSFCLFVVFVLGLFIHALPTRLQAQQILWQTTIGGSSGDNAQAYEIARDGCYMVVGGTRSIDVPQLGKTTPDTDVMIAKVNSKGRVLWKKRFGGTGYDEAFDVKMTRDGGFIIVGGTESSVYGIKGGKDFLVLRLDALGAQLWAKSFGGSGNDIARAVEVFEDGSCLVVGETSSKDGNVSKPYNGIDGWMVRVDPKGNLLWEKSVGGKLNDQLNAIAKSLTTTGTFEGAVYVVGTTESTDGVFRENKGKSDIAMMKVSLTGEVAWSKTIGGDNIDIAYGVATSYDGKVMIAGTTSSSSGMVKSAHGTSNDIFVAHIDLTGNMVWSKSYGGSGEEGANGISLTFERNFVIAATTNSKDGDLLETKGSNDAWCFMIDGEGRMIWQKVMGGTGVDQFMAAKEVPSGDFVAIGPSTSTDGDLANVFRSKNTDYWIACLKKPIDNGVRSITPTTVTGYIRNADTKKFIKAEVRVVKNEKLQKISADKSDTTFGVYQVFLPDTDKTSIGVFADGYMFFGKNIDISSDDRYSEIRLDIELKPIKVGTILDLYNITFEIGRHKLMDESKPELERLVQFLNQNNTVHIQINGHTDATGAKDTKQKLSELRAQSVMSYLVERGVHPGRLTSQGFGMSKPIADESTEEGRQKNRRVEIQITKN